MGDRPPAPRDGPLEGPGVPAPEPRCPYGRNCQLTRIGQNGLVVACEDPAWPPCSNSLEFGQLRICRVLSDVE